MAVRLDADGLLGIIEDLEEEAQRFEERTQGWLGHFMVAKLRSAGSLVNVLTGRMRHSFVWQRLAGRGGGGTIVIGNTAVNPRNGFPYPLVIEREFGGAERTLRQQADAVLDAALSHAEAGDDPPRAFRQS